MTFGCHAVLFGRLRVTNERHVCDVHLSLVVIGWNMRSLTALKTSFRPAQLVTLHLQSVTMSPDLGL